VTYLFAVVVSLIPLLTSVKTKKIIVTGA
jgi:hypothetical protein